MDGHGTDAQGAEALRWNVTQTGDRLSDRRCWIQPIETTVRAALSQAENRHARRDGVERR
jgi:hypothetical protein